MQAGEIPESFHDAATNACTLPIGGGAELAVFGIPDSDDVFVAVDVMPAGRHSGRSELFALCMSMNAYALQTRGGAVGYDAEREKIVLTYRISSSLIDPEALGRIAANLLDAATGLRRSLAELVARQDKAFEIERDDDRPVVLKG